MSINTNIRYSKITLDGMIYYENKSVNVKIKLRNNADQDIEKFLETSLGGDSHFSLDLKPLIERECPICHTKFYPELMEKRNQIYDKDACKSKAYRERKKKGE